jgi:tRNA(Arg) A34 adenosine deaminase TadA
MLVQRAFVAALVLTLSTACGGMRARPDAGAEDHRPDRPAASARGPVVEERDTLFMLAAMSFTFAGLGSTAGYDISAVIAWDVDDPAVTPEFVIDRNRNNEMQGDIHHAEINTLRDAYRKRWDYHVAPGDPAEKRRTRYASALTGATLYTTLEPCPMCQTTITMAKVPRAVFCMEDPGLRSTVTHETSVVVPKEFYGRTLSIERSGIVACEQANRAMWKAVESKRGPARFSITAYVTENGRAIFRPAWDALSCWTPQPANAALLEALRQATGATDCRTAGPAR